MRTWSSPLFMVLALITLCFIPSSLKILRFQISLNFGLEFSLLMPSNLVLLILLQSSLFLITAKLLLLVVIITLISATNFPPVVVPTMAASDVVAILSSAPLHSHKLRLLFLCNINMCLHWDLLLHQLGLLILHQMVFLAQNPNGVSIVTQVNMSSLNVHIDFPVQILPLHLLEYIMLLIQIDTQTQVQLIT